MEYDSGSTQQNSLNTWFQTLAGRALYKKLTSELQQILLTMTGQVAVELVGAEQAVFLKSGMMPYVFTCRTDLLVQANEQTLICDYTDLPLESDSVNLVVLSFALEQVVEPQRVLCEVYRVLKPGGQLVIFGMNQLSIYRRPKGVRRYSLWRIKKWLSSIGYGIIRNQTLGFLLSSAETKRLTIVDWVEVMGQLLVPKMGTCYIVYAQKKVAGTTPLIAFWERQQRYIRSNSVVGSMRDHV
jgi:SAM-dependent methyltransferase